MLIQPVPLWMQLLAEGFLPATGSQTFICGVVMLGISIARLNMAVTPMFLLALPLLLISRLLIEMGLSYIASCRAFYYPVQYEEVAANVASLCGQIEYYPLSGLPQVLQLVLDTVLPLGLLTYVPSLILLGRLPYLLTAWPLLVGLILCNIAAALFRKGLVHYANKGCSRYKSMGHRS